MSEGRQESEYLRKIKEKRANLIYNADYQEAKDEFEAQLDLEPGEDTFYICQGLSREKRVYIAKCFKDEGFMAAATDSALMSPQINPFGIKRKPYVCNAVRVRIPD